MSPPPKKKITNTQNDDITKNNDGDSKCLQISLLTIYPAMATENEIFIFFFAPPHLAYMAVH